MQITFFFLSCIIAIYFIVISEKVSKTWIKQSFRLYSILFTITALIIGGIFINHHKSALLVTARALLFDTEIMESKDTRVSQHSIKNSVKLNAPLIGQLPALPRGCEVTSLAMLLQYHHINVDKMELAKKVKKNPAPYKMTDQGIFFGNPHNGFVGDMYSYTTPGLGVYHEPIAVLAAQYVGERVHDFTGEDFSMIMKHLNEERPVWVIINATYRELPEKYFTTWHTEDGPINVTMKEHSVLVTGYDQEFIYFNDPLKRATKAPIKDFKAAWIQMGKQAITIF